MSVFGTGLLSVIVPIYNTEKFLVRCIESILSQTYKNLEVILVDDGSTDGSSKICDQYAEKDNRIKVIHKRNEGRTKARREGVLASSGDVVTFVDSDDWMDSETYEQMMEVFSKTECELVSGGIIRDYEISGKREIAYDNFPEGLYTAPDSEIFPTMLWDYKNNTHGLFPNLCTKLFRNKIIKDVLCRINTEIFYGEDCLAFYTYCLQIKRYYILHKAGYHYNIRHGSTCWSADPKLLVNSYLLYTEFNKEFSNYSNPYILVRQLKRYILELVEKHNLLMLFDIDLNAYGDWQFDYDVSMFDSEYIIYGAGACGQALYSMLRKYEKTDKLVAWVDKRPEGKSALCLHDVVSISEIEKLKYDFIVIAVKDEKVAGSIRDDLIRTYQVDNNKIIWKKAVQEMIFKNCIF